MNHDQIPWRHRLTRAAPYLLLLVGAYLLYAQSFGHQWTMDDHVVVTGNADIRSLKGLLADSYPGRPLREITYLLDYQLFGGQPAGYHLQNIFWHGLNACLLAMLARALGLAQPLAWLAGLLFLVHPLNVEVVANISHRKESLMLAFVLVALLAFLKSYQGERRWPWLGASAVALFVAWQAKQTAVGLMPVMLGYDLWIAPPERRLVFRRPWVVWAVAAAALAGVCAWYLIAWNTPSFQEALQSCLIKMNVYSGQSGALFLLFALKALAFMWLRLLWPLELAMEYVFPAPGGWSDPWVLASLLLVAAFGVAAWMGRRQAPLLIGLLMMAGFWLPVSNLFWPISYFAADRYMYAVSAGFVLIVIWAGEWLLGNLPKVLWGSLLAVCVILAVLAWRQDRVWATEQALYQQALVVSPTSTTALLGLGAAYLNQGNLPEAQAVLEKGAMNFNDSKALYLLAITYERQGNQQGAISYYRRFVQMNEPRYAQEVANARRQLLRYGVVM